MAYYSFILFLRLLQYGKDTKNHIFKYEEGEELRFIYLKGNKSVTLEQSQAI